MASISACIARRHQMVSRDVAARALWAAFPSRSEHELCNRAASVLGTSPDTVKRILRRETDAKLSLVWPILAMGLAAKGIDALEAIGAGNSREPATSNAREKRDSAADCIHR